MPVADRIAGHPRPPSVSASGGSSKRRAARAGRPLMNLSTKDRPSVAAAKAAISTATAYLTAAGARPKKRTV